MIKVGIIGGAGYTGGELIRLLLHHPQAEIVFVHSQSQAGKPLHSTHQDLIGETDVYFTDKISQEVDAWFLCMGHGRSRAFLEVNPPAEHLRVIDLSNEFRLSANNEAFIYGLPELHRPAIQGAKHIANPGCFATAIQLGLLPLASAGLLHQSIHVHAITGATGAGQQPRSTTHFAWRDNNVSIYKAFKHQHLDEIKQSLQQLQNDFKQNINFLPLRGNFSRGIFASIYIEAKEDLDKFQKLYADYYKDAPFTHLTNENPALKQVVNTNKCLLHLMKEDGKLLIISMIDNLLKGASGQAVQNMNLMFGLEETMGLRLKASYF